MHLEPSADPPTTAGQTGSLPLTSPLERLRDRLAEWQRCSLEHPEGAAEIIAATYAEVHQDLAEVTSMQQATLERQACLQKSLDACLLRSDTARNAAESSAGLNDEFIATISHELRTPLTAILGWVRVLRSLHADDGPTRNAVSSIERSAKMQARLIEDLLDMSHMTLGRLMLDPKPVDVGSIVAGALSVVAPSAEAKQVELVPSSSADVFIVVGDAVRLQQVFWNLLANGVKFTPPGGSVAVDITVVGSDVQVVVRDTGIGIDTPFLPFVFDRFRRGDGGPSRRYSGLGLGLSIVRHLVVAHGGTVAADSAGAGKGAVFTVTLPLERRIAERRRELRLPFPEPEPLEPHDAIRPPDR